MTGLTFRGSDKSGLFGLFGNSGKAGQANKQSGYKAEAEYRHIYGCKAFELIYNNFSDFILILQQLVKSSRNFIDLSLFALILAHKGKHLRKPSV